VLQNEKFATHVMHKELIPKVYKELLPINKKTDNPIEKWGKDLNQHFTGEEMQLNNNQVEI
jgi:hypothetical protein